MHSVVHLSRPDWEHVRGGDILSKVRTHGYCGGSDVWWRIVSGVVLRELCRDTYYVHVVAEIWECGILDFGEIDTPLSSAQKRAIEEGFPLSTTTDIHECYLLAAKFAPIIVGALGEYITELEARNPELAQGHRDFCQELLAYAEKEGFHHGLQRE